eukprot:gnl/TRDRNA2_/TRDRNA2_176167_c3_seq12.p1 gnl/TRDRNA2_/TRDRNA2_176167_c3~~gnl/TRDRNA2_/TRDRNA2_176167_c3_seq12.p1  ORF type:complete len:105 (+),score=13.36 gnl/TRDRNA2_/TRDRNA2_176167_c3_seq12:113-427(+)
MWRQQSKRLVALEPEDTEAAMPGWSKGNMHPLPKQATGEQVTRINAKVYLQQETCITRSTLIAKRSAQAASSVSLPPQQMRADLTASACIAVCDDPVDGQINAR